MIAAGVQSLRLLAASWDQVATTLSTGGRRTSAPSSLIMAATPSSSLPQLLPGCIPKCGFTEPKGQLLLIDGKTIDDVRRSLERVLLTMRITTAEPKDVAFVVDGLALEIALKHYKKAFSELAILSRTAICCRVTPSQKAQNKVQSKNPHSALEKT
ncbi:hypothetical protein Cgig2_027283 [Carnegiea gigantea]|uniref:Uncharacterized protein n=1 Tax=Carnegiea gigantea TaxID=171969 RepID=A0A9Q1K3D8_9CARY|nr:hypothetical protein Cgig2_027283 [Carnegiea gigantea]